VALHGRSTSPPKSPFVSRFGPADVEGPLVIAPSPAAAQADRGGGPTTLTTTTATATSATIPAANPDRHDDRQAAPHGDGHEDRQEER
jgi:hypothetical protein